MVLTETVQGLRAAYIGIRRETPDEFQARKIELARRQKVASKRLEQVTGVTGVFIDPEDEFYLEENRERLRRELRQIASEKRAKSPRTELVAGLSPTREAAVVLPEVLASLGQTAERLTRGAISIVGKIARIQTETPTQAARRRFLLRQETSSVVASYERWDEFLYNDGLASDEVDEAEFEVGRLRTRKDELFAEVVRGTGIRTEVVLFGGRLGRFGRITLHEATRENTPRPEPVKVLRRPA